MQSSPINFHPQQLFKPHVTKMNFTTEVIQQSELTRLVRRFKHNNAVAKRIRETISETHVKIAFIIKQPNTLRALPCLHDQLNSTSLKPPLTLANQCFNHILSKSARMFLTKLKLHL